ncbi:MAG: hypothetical protein WCC15_00085, partial [Candidatus Acidiferrales bacterium]
RIIRQWYFPDELLAVWLNWRRCEIAVPTGLFRIRVKPELWSQLWQIRLEKTPRFNTRQHVKNAVIPCKQGVVVDFVGFGKTGFLNFESGASASSATRALQAE